MDAMPYMDFLFGNETEARAFAESEGWTTTDVAEIALKVSHLSVCSQCSHHPELMPPGVIWQPILMKLKVLQPVHAISFQYTSVHAYACRWRHSPNRMAAAPAQSCSLRARTQLWSHLMARYVQAFVLAHEIYGRAWLLHHMARPDEAAVLA